jgi:hypothetical protein
VSDRILSVEPGPNTVARLICKRCRAKVRCLYGTWGAGVCAKCDASDLTGDKRAPEPPPT